MDQQPPKRYKRFALLLIIIGILLLGIFFYFHSKSSNVVKVVPTITPSPTDFQFPTETATPTTGSGSSTPTVSNTPSAKPTAGNPVDKATGLDRSTLSVSVQNGSGVVGAGSKASDFLKNLGYKVTSIGNAPNFDFQNVTIQVAPGKSQYLPLLKTDLSGTYSIGTATSDLSASSSADVVVIIGK